MRLLALALVMAVSACASLSIAQSPQPVGGVIASAEITIQDAIWAKVDNLDLQARIYRPLGGGDHLPVLIDVHGGAWGAYDRTSGALYDTELARSGLLVIAIDFRQSPDFQHPKGSADVAAAVRWVRLNARKLGADPDRIGLIGSSSGGHLALLAALRPNHPSHSGTPIAGDNGQFAVHDEISADVDYVVAMWPVSDPQARYRYAKRSGQERLVDLTERYFADEEAMWDASIPRIVTSGEAERLPPILVVQPGMDSNIPQDMTLELIRAWQARDGKLEYSFYPDQPHAFGHRASDATLDLIATTTHFIQRQNSTVQSD